MPDLPLKFGQVFLKHSVYYSVTYSLLVLSLKQRNSHRQSSSPLDFLKTFDRDGDYSGSAESSHVCIAGVMLETAEQPSAVCILGNDFLQTLDRDGDYSGTAESSHVCIAGVMLETAEQPLAVCISAKDFVQTLARDGDYSGTAKIQVGNGTSPQFYIRTCGHFFYYGAWNWRNRNCSA
ncbi:hypothetical protein AVEN_40517-1 [Araneus ventricosus]|uniref:Uncharacterized protein n=1 Tax=Araneus ventricosus TaxID=182803 RepID=A0A4Y2SX63_ARAVE|nr:hypothetical protein AVEN_40517-1 [Araneus ventricosus]